MLLYYSFDLCFSRGCEEILTESFYFFSEGYHWSETGVFGTEELPLISIYTIK
jgi:hypothetical protein